MHVGNQRHWQFWLPLFDEGPSFSYDSPEAMRLFMWHLYQKGVASCLLHLLDGIDEFLTGRLHCVPSAMLAAWTSFNSLSLPSPANG